MCALSVGSFTQDFRVVRYLKHAQVLMHLVCPCHKRLLPLTVHNVLALVNIIHIHVCGCALSILVKPGSATHFPTSTASAGLQCLWLVPVCTWFGLELRVIACVCCHVSTFSTHHIWMDQLFMISLYSCQL